MLICVDTLLTQWSIQPASIGFNPCHPPAPLTPILARPGFTRLVHFCPILAKARRSGRSDFSADLTRAVKTCLPQITSLITHAIFPILIAPDSEQVSAIRDSRSTSAAKDRGNIKFSMWLWSGEGVNLAKPSSLAYD